MFKYFPHTADDVRQMLDVIGVGSLEELYAEVPEELKYQGALNIPSAMSEVEVRNAVRNLAADNQPVEACYAGNGAYDHYQPSVVPYIASRSEFSTSYTPIRQKSAKAPCNTFSSTRR